LDDSHGLLTGNVVGMCDWLCRVRERRSTMEAEGQFTSGNWVVKEQNEDLFVERWTEFAQWSKETASGVGNVFFLIRDASNPRHFISLGSWSDFDSVNRWRSSPGFAERLNHCRELCEEFKAGDYVLAARVT
jgi:heme-degrading monooxygenase HmoA